MESMTSTDKLLFSTWARKIAAQHSEILEHMRRSTDPLERAIAVRITAVANER
jgi:hypothetical protein